MTVAVARMVACRLTLTGLVQGLGVRPAIHRLATELGLAGSVSNTSAGVVVEMVGPVGDIEKFRQRLPTSLPGLPDSIQVEPLPLPDPLPCTFQIVAGDRAGPLAVPVPLDRGMCENCCQDVRNRSNRRHGYAFTSCTACGPRYSIVRALPYEREHTGMADFPLCSSCRAEYSDPTDRRFHAQTIACAECGPRWWHGRDTGETPALPGRVARAVRDGQILALRGLGGYQLLCDASHPEAVRRLRQGKHRPHKPLAVLVASLAEAEKLAFLDNLARQTLTSPENPIVLVRARSDSGLAPAVHPGLKQVGLLLPTTPLHQMLAEAVGSPLVCTSGNREGEPLVTEIGECERQLDGLADLLVHHDRPILQPIDDSVMQLAAGRAFPIRLARGLAPLPLPLPETDLPLLAVGGQQKAALAWHNGLQAALGPHIGDLESLATRTRFAERISGAQQLYRFQPARILHDAHPDYASTFWAEESGICRLAVQHHHAHIVAGMLDQVLQGRDAVSWLQGEVLGLAWDGTGYGLDGTIWGGEVLLASVRGMSRVGRLRPFRLPGGEAAIREPWRVTLALLAETLGRDAAHRWLHSRRLTRGDALLRLLDSDRLSPWTSSMGRLFDGIAALLFEDDLGGFEGRPAMLLEAVAEANAAGRYPLPIRERPLLELDWRPLVRAVWQDQQRGLTPGMIAARFHRTLAQVIVELAQRWPRHPVVVSGGVFQNCLLLEMLVEEWHGRTQPLGLPGRIPPNDGGLAAGQLVVGLNCCGSE